MILTFSVEFFLKNMNLKIKNMQQNPNCMTLKYYSKSKILIQQASVTYAKSNKQK